MKQEKFVNGDAVSHGNSATLTKVDKLRELIGTGISLPQLVVVGDQSSGKSSVLEGITGFAFPRDAELCTRYATQITCRREDNESIMVTIIPHKDTAPAEAAELCKFSRKMEDTTEMDDTKLAEIFRDANKALGVGQLDSSSAFSQHLLKIEIGGPEQQHFTVIDVPGIFRKETEGITTESDIELVRDLVQGYMKDQRTIILAIVPANVDPATQEILKLAKKVDPEMTRTMGVLTKPDLAIEKTMQQIAIDHVTGKRSDLTLGYHIVKNRGSDDIDATLVDGQKAEDAFFSKAPWSVLKPYNRAGIGALKAKVHALLENLIKEEFPKLRNEVKEKLAQLIAERDAMGPPRSEPSSQRAYVGNLCEQFQAIVRDALNANYTGRSIFKDDRYRLITRIVELDDMFADGVREQGHTKSFSTTETFRCIWGGSGDDEVEEVPSLKQIFGSLPLTSGTDEPMSTQEKELWELIEDGLQKPTTTDLGILAYIKQVYNNSRGADLGTFSGSLLRGLFQEQTKNWEPITTAYMKIAILFVQRFIKEAMAQVCPDKTIQAELTNHLSEEIEARYLKAEKQTRFLVDMECVQHPYTLNHYFNENVAKAQSDRIIASLKGLVSIDEDGFEHASSTAEFITTKEQLSKIATPDQSNSEHIQDYILIVLESYYKVAMKRFVDNVCLQAVHHFLLFSDDGPLRVFNSAFVHGLDDDALDQIAGESPAAKANRERLCRDIANYKEALDVLKGGSVKARR